jgi:hypothetical protein
MTRPGVAAAAAGGLRLMIPDNSHPGHPLTETSAQLSLRTAGTGSGVARDGSCGEPLETQTSKENWEEDGKRGFILLLGY